MLNLTNIPPSLNLERRQQFVRNAVEASANDGSFTYTDVMSLEEPLRTDVLGALDGMWITSGRSEQKNSVLMQGTVRLVHIESTKTISLSVWDSVRKPGTNDMKRIKARKDFGNMADVPDYFPDRLARLVLHQFGWPSRQAKEGSSIVGCVVEWRWLEREVKSGTATPDAVELYEDILKRHPSLASPPTDAKSTNKSNRGGVSAPAGV